ncbi:MAG: Hsp70 family protein [Myxococcota bacterium]
MIVGIDLGTSYSTVAVVVGGKPLVILDDKGRGVQPSVVSFPDGGGVLVGYPARARLVTDSPHTVYSVKRLIGRRFTDPETQAFQQGVPYHLVEGPGGGAAVEARGKIYSAPEISAYVLRHMKHLAERHLGAPVEKAVVTVPANFNDAQREATRIAGRIAGLDVVRIVNEPTAAALSYGFGKDLDRTLAVYDFGGGTFDLTLLEAKGAIFRVVTTNGDMLLGGDDFDQALAKHVHDAFWRQSKIELRRDAVEWARLVLAAETCKRELSSASEADVRIPRVAHTPKGVLDLDVHVTRDQFNALVLDLVQRTFEVCTAALESAGLGVANIDDLVLVGGTTHVPLVRAAAEQYFRRKPRPDVDPETAVAVGAAIHAAALGGDDQASRLGPGAPSTLLLDVLPRTIGLAAAGGFTERVIERSTAIPVEQTSVFATSRDGQQEVRIIVVQGESKHTRENTLLGELIIDGLRPAPRGEVEIEVTFEVDQSGILNITARDRDSGRELQKKIRISGELRDEAIDDAARRVERDGS